MKSPHQNLQEDTGFQNAYKAFLESPLPFPAFVENDLKAHPQVVELCDYEACMLKTKDPFLHEYSVDFGQRIMWRHPKMEWVLISTPDMYGVPYLTAEGVCPCCGFKIGLLKYSTKGSIIAQLVKEEEGRLQTAYKLWKMKPEEEKPSPKAKVYSKLGQEFVGHITDMKVSKAEIYKSMGVMPPYDQQVHPSPGQLSDMVATIASVAANLSDLMVNVAKSFDNLTIAVKFLASITTKHQPPHLSDEVKQLILSAQGASVSPATFKQLQSIAQQVHGDIKAIQSGAKFPFQGQSEGWGKGWTAGPSVTLKENPLEAAHLKHLLAEKDKYEKELLEKKMSALKVSISKDEVNMVKKMADSIKMEVLKAKGIGDIHVSTPVGPALKFAEMYDFPDNTLAWSYGSGKGWKPPKEKIPPPQPAGPTPQRWWESQKEMVTISQ